MLLIPIFFFSSTNSINKLKKSLKGTWNFSASIKENPDFIPKINDIFLINKTFVKIYQSNSQISENISNYANEIDTFYIDFVHQSNNSNEVSLADLIQRYVISFCQDEIVYFNDINNINEKIQIKIDSSKLPLISTSGKYMNKYVFHYLMDSNTKMHLSLFSIQNDDDTNPYFADSWLQLDFLKDVDRLPPSLLEKNWPFILLAAVFIINYIIGFWRQNKKLNRLIQMDNRPASTPTKTSKKAMVLKVD